MAEALRTALITGGSSGIGLACGRLLMEQGGYRVALTARRPEPLQKAAAEIGADWIAGDASDPESFAEVVEQLPRVDLLIHAGGIRIGTYVRKQTQDDWDDVITADLRSCHVIVQASLPKMKPGSRIIFLSSMVAHEPEPSLTAYSAAKAGMNAFALALSREVDRDGIAVHIVTPGPVDTAMLEDLTFSLVPLTADDVAKVVVWLDTLDPKIMLPEIEMRAVSRGPFAPSKTVAAPKPNK